MSTHEKREPTPVTARAHASPSSDRVALAYSPDPDAFHLAIVAKVAALYMKGGEKYGSSCSPLAVAFKRHGLGDPDFALFWDFARCARAWTSPSSPAMHRIRPAPPSCGFAPSRAHSLFQTPRSEGETTKFKQGLKQSNVWYGHARSVCWMQSELPEDFYGASYEKSGCALSCSLLSRCLP